MRKTGAILAAAALVLPACGSANQDAIAASGVACPKGSGCYDPVKPVGPGSALELEAGDLWFRYDGVRSDQDDLVVQGVEGDLLVTLVNTGTGPHNFRIDETVVDDEVADPDAAKKVEAAGSASETGSLPLFSGTYSFYCDIPGHRAGGMEGTIEILSAADAAAAGEADVSTGGASTDADADGADQGPAGEDASPSEDDSPSDEPSPATEG